MSLRANGRAAEDLLTLIRALKDPSDLMGHLENIAKGSAKLAEDIDAVKAREDAVTQREAAAEAERARQTETSNKLFAAAQGLDRREGQVKAQMDNLQLAINNHSVDVAAFEARVQDMREEADRHQREHAALKAQMDKAFEEHATRKQALDDREVFLNGIEAALNERAKRIAEAVK